MSGTITDMALRRCPACRHFYIEDDRMYLDTDRCPACGVNMNNACSYATGAGSGAGTVPAEAWELEDGTGYWELEDGSGYWEKET